MTTSLTSKESSATAPGPREVARRRALLASGLLIVEAILVLGVLHRYTTRPYLFDEQWRAAWLGLGPRIGSRLHEVPAPMSAGWIGLEWSVTKVLPTNELTLRLPMLAAIPGVAVASYWLARRWVGDLIAFVTAALLVLNGPLLVYGMLLKPFVFDAFCCVVLLLGWRWADERDPSLRARLLVYAGLDMLTVLASAAVFVLVPLVVYDAVLAARAHRLGPHLQALWAPVLAMAIAGAHYVFFLAKQDLLLREHELHPEIEAYWQKFFVPHGGVLDIATFIGSRMKPFASTLTNSYLPPETNADPYLHDSIPPSPPAAIIVVLGVLFVGLVLWGVWRASRDERQRVLVVVVGGALVLLLAASYKEVWPFGLVRANLFLVPFVYVLAAIGAADIVRRARAALRSDDPVRRRLGAATLGGLALLALLVVPVSASTFVGLNDRYEHPQFIDRTRDAVAVVRENAGPDDLAISVLNTDGWQFYSFAYDDGRFPSDQRVDGDRTLLITRFDDPAIADFVRAHPKAQRVYLIDQMGVGGDDLRKQRTWLSQNGFCPTRSWDYPQTGILVEYVRSLAAATSCPEPVLQDVGPIG